MSFMNVVKAFGQVESTSGRNAKKAILADLVKTDRDLLKEVAEFTHNPFWMYRVTLSGKDFVGRPSMFSEEVVTDQLSNDFWGNMKLILTELRDRKIPLTLGKEVLVETISASPDSYRKVLIRIVNRDLRLGFLAWNDFFPNLIPNEPCMLCSKWDGHTLDGPVVVEPKLDGLRSLVVVDENGNCSSISRGNKELWNMERIFEQVKSLGLRDVVFDGEAIARNFGEAMSITKTQTAHKNQGLLKFQIFDLLTGDEFRSQKCTRPLIDRKSMLKEIFESGQAPNLIHTDYILTDSVSHLQEVHEQYCLEGYEGSVFKHTESPYLFDRSDLWLKVKPECEGDLKITGAEEGSGRLRGTLGALWVEGEVEYKKSKYDVVSKVGTGFSDSDRDRLWSLYQNHQLLGEIVEVKFQDVTSEVSMGTSRASLRFPKFSKIRNDK